MLIREQTILERALLQYVISLGIVNAGTLDALIDKIKENHDQIHAEELTEENLKNRTLEESIEIINRNLHQLGYEIAKTHSQTTNELYYIYINLVEDIPSKQYTKHTPKEIQIIKTMIEKIVIDNSNEVESYLISSTDALKLCANEGLTASQGTHLLKQLVDEAWLDLSPRGKYTLSLRALTELKRDLLDKYGQKTKDNPDGNIILCLGCNEIVTIGVSCHNMNCYAKFHKHCQRHYATAKGSRCANPECDVDWSELPARHIGEKALNLR